MHIAFFDLYEWEKSYIEEHLPGHRLSLFCEGVSEELLRTIPDVDIISVFIHSHLGKTEIDLLPQLKLITTRSTGYDHIDIAYCREMGICVSNVPMYGERTVAEHTFALLLTLSRKIHMSYVRTMKNNFAIDGLIGFDLFGKTIGILGAGHIGQHVIRIAKGFGMHVLAYDPYPNSSIAKELGYEYCSLEQLLSMSDVVSLHMPYSPENYHMIDEHALRLMKKDAILINTARGAIVDTAALLRVLTEGALGGVGMDVIEGEEDLMEEISLLEKSTMETPAISCAQVLIHRDDVVFTPHIAFYSKEALHRIACSTVENIQTYIESGEPRYGV